MKNKKDIGRLFQEKFKDFEEIPDELVWNAIEEKLRKKEEKKRVIPLWWKLSGVAALFIIGILLYQNSTVSKVTNEEEKIVFENDKNSTNDILIPEENEENNNKYEEKIVFENENASGNKENIIKKSNRSNWKTDKNAAVVSSKNNKSKISNEYFSNSKREKNTFINNKNSSFIRNSKEKIASQNTNQSEKSTINLNTENKLIFDLDKSITEKKTITNENKIDSTKTETSLAEVKVEPNALEELLSEKEKKPKVEPKLNKWEITTAIAPVYLGSSSNGSPIDSQFANNSKEYENTMSYGVGVNYSLNKKFTVRTGVNKVNLSYLTNNVEFYPEIGTSRIQNIKYGGQGVFINIQNILLEPRVNLNASQFGSIQQMMSYYEVPLEVSYRLLNKKFGINLIGGVSSFVLDDNKIMVVSNDFSALVGEANNLNKLHFSTNFGIGFRYSFFKSFQANFEPTFKYQLNAFSHNNGGFRPYFIGLYSGISYRF
ncbi:MAG: hypothetical protein ACOVQR_12470 [Flavobacterium sp.]|jgi:hypothetical protein|uniref:hypothetical protein n=1 Tax=Flavobacterium sp. TaxID=239 RepID=UPI003BA6153B